jgi:very-short-patch-repair endonuclease
MIERGKLETWKSNIGKSVSAAILSNPKEIERRKELSKMTITAWAKSKDGRKKESETAIKTSARQDIQEARSTALQNWRDEKPEDFYQKCIVAMHNTFVSKPQLILFRECKKIDSGFKHNQQIKNELFSNKTRRRQIDVLQPTKKIIVEFDGPCHFRKFRAGQDLGKTKVHDNELNEVLSASGYAIVRVSYEDYYHRQGGSFSQRVLEQIKSLVENQIPGIYKVGEAYDKY